MKILCVMMKYDYGDITRGNSFEYNTFYKYFEKEGYEVELFDFGELNKRKGKKKTSILLKKILKKDKYDLAFCVPFTDQFDTSVLDNCLEYKTPFVAWMCDDKWRWENFSKNICWLFNYVVTTDPEAIKKYESIGYNNAILSQWAFESSKTKMKTNGYKYDVSFVGQVNPWRRYVIEKIRKNGIKVDCFGYGWENGRITDEEMRRIFRESKINLNISNSVQWDWGYLLRVNWDVDKKMDFPHRVINMFPLIHTLFFPKRKEDIKARFFEVTGCNGFLLSYDVEHLKDYFSVGKEVVCYENIVDSLKKIRYYLKDEKSRKEIAEAGFRRTKLVHSYKNRFKGLFDKMGIYGQQ